MPASATWTATTCVPPASRRLLQALLTSLKKKNIFQLPGLVRKVFSVCETSLNVGDMLGMSPIVFGGLNLETLSIPGEEEQAYGATLDSGAWVYEYDLTAASQHINRFIYEEESPYYTGQNKSKTERKGAFT